MAEVRPAGVRRRWAGPGLLGASVHVTATAPRIGRTNTVSRRSSGSLRRLRGGIRAGGGRGWRLTFVGSKRFKEPIPLLTVKSRLKETTKSTSQHHLDCFFFLN